MSDQWQSPPGYRAESSALEGITVFAPVPVEEKTLEPKSYKCPNCGAVTAYDVAAGGVACEHCGFKTEAQSVQVGRSAEEHEFTLEALNRAEKGWGVERQELACSSCGAVMTVETKALAVTCPFCGSNRVNLRSPSTDDHIRPRFVIPFKIQPSNLAALAQKWLGAGWFHPDDLARQVGVDRFTGIYLPFWTFGAGISAGWRAEVGHEEAERYYDHEKKSWKTRTVIKWRWESGQVSLEIQDHLVSGSGRLSKKILERIYPFDLNGLMTYSPDFLAGWQASSYDVNLPEAWEQAKSAMRDRAKSACYSDTGSSHVRNFSMIADFNDEVWRYILLPVYLSSYKFETRTYQVMLNGQSGKIDGQKPVAWWKVWLAVAALLSPGLCLGLVGLPLTLAAGTGVIFLILGVILLVIGGIVSGVIIKKALDSEAS